MKYQLCSKCGASHSKTSKHKPIVREGVAWCGHCGNRLTSYNKRFSVRQLELNDIYPRASWKIVFESENKTEAMKHFQAHSKLHKHRHFRLIDESTPNNNILSATC
jgi:hypothetical protein